MRKEIIASLDVGTANVRCAVAAIDPRGDVQILGMCSRPSMGMRKELIVDVEASAACVREVVTSAERMAGGSISSLYVALSPLHAVLQTSKGMVAVLGEGHEVSQEDIARVMQATRVSSLPPNREIVDMVVRQYIVDGYGGLKDPTSIIGMRLELDALLVVGNLTALSSLRRSVERAGYTVAGFVLKPLALGELMFSEDERELGVQLVDVGAAVTETAYFEEGTLRAIGAVPVGGAYVTSDLAVGLRVSTKTAERLKTEVDWFSQPEDKAVDLASFGHLEARRVTAREVIEIMEPRYEEMLSLVRQQCREMSGKDVPNGGYVLTGGTAKHKSFLPMVRRIIGNRVRVNLDTYGAVDDPGYNVAVALLTYTLARRGRADGTKKQSKNSRGLFATVKGFFNDFWE
ncbi:MAG: Cell division protein FtsA [Firmicutes bacterium]|nr:Cell division protein FtsA [Bacillota bacterium]